MTEWNSRINLTGIAEPGRMIIELFLDSLIAAPYLPSKGRMLDVGSGAGFPAVVIKIITPDLNLRLVESSSKKASFLKQVIRSLKLNGIEVLKGRIESIKDSLHAEGFDVISSRALANLNHIINWCACFLAEDGRLVYFSGSRSDEELENSKHLMSDYNLTVERLIPYRLPGMGASRSIIILRKRIIMR